MCGLSSRVVEEERHLQRLMGFYRLQVSVIFVQGHGVTDGETRVDAAIPDPADGVLATLGIATWIPKELAH